MSIIAHSYNDIKVLYRCVFAHIDIHIDTFDTTTTLRHYPLLRHIYTTPAIPK